MTLNSGLQDYSLPLEYPDSHSTFHLEAISYQLLNVWTSIVAKLVLFYVQYKTSSSWI